MGRPGLKIERYSMSTNITAVQNTNSIRDSEFVLLRVTFTNGSNTITRDLAFSTAYRALTIQGVTYNQIAGLLAVTAHQRDLAATGYDTGITITGLDSLYMYFVAGAPAVAPVPVAGQDPIPVGYYPLIKGSEIQIRRGFWDEQYNLTSSHLRYTGIVTSYAIQEEYGTGFRELDGSHTIVLQCSALKQTLENRVAGRKTNATSWRRFAPTDTAMDRVAALENRQFDFGRDLPAPPGRWRSAVTSLGANE